MAKRILGIAASVLLLVFSAFNSYVFVLDLKMHGSYIEPNGADGYIMSFSFKTMFEDGFVWSVIIALLIFVAVAAIALINIFKKNTVMTSILLGGSVFACLLYVFKKSSCTIGTSYFMVARSVYSGGASFESTLAVQDLIFLYSYIVIAVLLVIDLALTYLEKKKLKAS